MAFWQSLSLMSYVQLPLKRMFDELSALAHATYVPASSYQVASLRVEVDDLFQFNSELACDLQQSAC